MSEGTPASGSRAPSAAVSPVALTEEARADRRVVITALVVMVALVLFGIGFGSLYGATNCRQLRPVLLDATSPQVPSPTTTGAEVRDVLTARGVEAHVLDAVEMLAGPVVLTTAVLLDAPSRLGPSASGVLVTGDGAVLLAPDGVTRSVVRFRRPVTVVGDGGAVYALVVGNTITGQVDALRPFLPGPDGFTPGTCVDTSAVGSPLSFLHDARDGDLLGLRTDEDGSDVVLELRDPTRGRVWAPVIELPRAPAGLHGARTSGAIGPGAVVLARRIGVLLDDPALDDPGHALQAIGRSDGRFRWTLGPAEVRAVLPVELADLANLRLEVAHVDEVRVLVTVAPDVASDAPLRAPVHGPLVRRSPPDPRTVTLEVAVADGRILGVMAGASPIGRDGPEREGLLRALRDLGFQADDVLVHGGSTWVLLGDVVVRFG